MNGSTEKNPMLKEEVHVKDYGKLNVPLSEQDKNTPIPDPGYNPPPFAMDLEEQPSADNRKEASSSEPDDIESKSKGEKKKEAQQLAEAAIAGYEMLHQFPEMLIKISEVKSKDLHLKGEINLNTIIPLPDGSSKSVKTIIEEFNADITGKFFVSQDFKEKVTPLLTRILQKKDVGLSDENLLCFYLILDLYQKGQLAFGLLANKRQVLEELKEATKLLRSHAVHQPVNPSPSSVQPEPVSPLQDGTGTVQNIKNDGTIEDIEVSELKPTKRGRGRKPKE